MWYVEHWHEDKNSTCGTVIFQLEHCAHLPLAPLRLRKVACSYTLHAISGIRLTVRR
jgi:hypothetical protein